MPNPVKLTRDGYARLERTLERERTRLDEARDVVREQLEANEAENLGLNEAQRQLMAVEARVEELEDALSRAEVIEADAQGADTVTLGSVVVLRNEAGGRETRAQLVAPAEASVTAGGMARISTDSPVGSRLLGRRVGERLSVPVGKGGVTYLVCGVFPSTAG